MIKTEIAFYLYLAVAISTIVWGVLYLVWPNFLPYHRKAVGLQWKDVSPGFKILIISLFKISGGPVVASGLAMIILLAIPFRESVQWAYWAIPLISLVANLPVFWGTMKMFFQTDAVSPWLQIAFALVGTIISYALACKALPTPLSISNTAMTVAAIIFIIIFTVLHLWALKIYDKLNQ